MRRSRSSATRCRVPSGTSARRSSRSSCTECARRRRRRSSSRCSSRDLPVFLRWRGEPPWGSPELDQMVGAHRPAHRRLDGVGGPAVSLHASRRAVRAHRGVRHRLVAHVALARAARIALARHRGRRHDPRARHAGAGALARRLAAVAARARRHRARGGRVRAPRGNRPRREAGVVPTGRPAVAERRALRRARPLHPRPGLRGRGSRDPS